MNKRQKKKMDLKLKWENELKILKNDKRVDKAHYNIEGYRDETAYQAIENVSKKGY